MTARHAAPPGTAEIRLDGGTAAPLATKADVQAVCNAVRHRRERWAAIEQLFASLPPISWTLVDTPAPDPCDDWPQILVQAAALVHVRASSFMCLGYTTWSSGRARCGRCGWSMSARMGDVGTFGSARFAHAAIARVGQAIALAVGVVAQALFEAVLPC